LFLYLESIIGGHVVGKLEPIQFLYFGVGKRAFGVGGVGLGLPIFNGLLMFCRINERELFAHAGKISHQQAVEKAHAEYDKYRALTIDEPSPVEQHFIEAVQAVTQLEKKGVVI